MKAIVFLEPRGTAFEVIRVAKERGFKTISISTDLTFITKAPEAYKESTKAIDQRLTVENWSDFEKLLSLVRQIGRETEVAGIYFSFDPCALAGARLRKEFNLPSPTPEAMALILDKKSLRAKLRSLGLSKIKSLPQKECDELSEWPFKGAAYFKPSRGFFSAYVKRCNNLEEFKAARDEWVAGSPLDSQIVKSFMDREAGYHLEEAFDGELLSVEAISHRGEFKALGLLSRILYSKDNTVEMGSCFPYAHPFENEILNYVRSAHEALGFSDGPSHTEVMVKPSGEVEIIDFNPRFVGADVLQSINHAFQARIEENLFEFALGFESHLPSDAKAVSCIQYFLPPEAAVFEELRFPKDPSIKFTAAFLTPGTPIHSIDRQVDYLGCYLTVMPTLQQALERSKQLREDVLVNRTLKAAY